MLYKVTSSWGNHEGSMLLWALIAYQTRYLGEMREPDSSLNSFAYVKAFQRWLKDRMARSRRVQRHLYPLVFLAFMVGARASDGGQAVIRRYGTEKFGAPLYVPAADVPDREIF